jgi:hypothetical protein
VGASKLTEKKRDGVEQVSEYKLQGEMVDAETASDPGEEPVDCCNERQDSQHVRTMEV